MRVRREKGKERERQRERGKKRERNNGICKRLIEKEHEYEKKDSESTMM